MCHRFSPNGALWYTTRLLSTICMCGHHLLTQQAKLSMSRRFYISCRTQRQIMTRIRLSFCARFTTSRVAFFTSMRRANCTYSEFYFIIRLQWTLILLEFIKLVKMFILIDSYNMDEICNYKSIPELTIMYNTLWYRGLNSKPVVTFNARDAFLKTWHDSRQVWNT
jgi:hypothetical protein